jgi:hypothetical protein
MHKSNEFFFLAILSDPTGFDPTIAGSKSAKTSTACRQTFFLFDIYFFLQNFFHFSSNIQTIEILGAKLHRRSMFEKREKFFQMNTTLFCEVKRGFADR